jgi:hypothetical protein
MTRPSFLFLAPCVAANSEDLYNKMFGQKQISVLKISKFTGLSPETVVTDSNYYKGLTAHK